MAALITGVGYLGAPLAAALLARGERVVALENYFSTPAEKLSALAYRDDFTLIEGDVADARSVATAFDRQGSDQSQATTVYHLAAQPSASVAKTDPDYTEHTNLIGARLVLEAARERGWPVIFAGSFRVYGDDLGSSEVDESRSYGHIADLSHLSKSYVEQLAQTLGTRFCSLRLGVVYGLGPVMKSDLRFMTVPNLFCQRAVSGRALEVRDDRPVAFVHIADAVCALVSAPGWLMSNDWGAFNIAPEVLTVSAVARTVAEAGRNRGLDVQVQMKGDAWPTEALFRVRSSADRLGFHGRRRLAESVGEVIDYFRRKAGQ